jgi:thiamine biosynthesis lipoprotein
VNKLNACLLLVFLTFLQACSPAPQSLSGQTMGTSYNVKYFGEPRPELNAAIDARLQELNAQLSTYRDDSEVSRFNAAAANEWFAVSASTADIVASALAISRQSDGAFDITVGPLVDLWGFGASDYRNSPPPVADIESRLAAVGYQNIAVQTTPPALFKTRADVAIDLSAIAKGYAVDEVGKLLDTAGLNAWLVEVGGELRTRGSKPNGADWQVAIEKPVPGQRSVQRIIALRDAAIATSGDYRNFFEFDGVRYSHSINPLTGWPVQDGIGSVSVIAASAMTADAWATALLVMGEAEALRLAEEQQLAVNLVLYNADGSVTESMSSAFQQLLSE